MTLAPTRQGITFEATATRGQWLTALADAAIATRRPRDYVCTLQRTSPETITLTTATATIQATITLPTSPSDLGALDGDGVHVDHHSLTGLIRAAAPGRNKAALALPITVRVISEGAVQVLLDDSPRGSLCQEPVAPRVMGAGPAPSMVVDTAQLKVAAARAARCSNAQIASIAALGAVLLRGGDGHLQLCGTDRFRISSTLLPMTTACTDMLRATPGAEQFSKAVARLTEATCSVGIDVICTGLSDAHHCYVLTNDTLPYPEMTSLLSAQPSHNVTLQRSQLVTAAKFVVEHNSARGLRNEAAVLRVPLTCTNPAGAGAGLHTHFDAATGEFGPCSDLAIAAADVGDATPNGLFGDEAWIGVNPRYLLDALTNLDADAITIHFEVAGQSGQQIILTAAGDVLSDPATHREALAQMRLPS